MYQIPRHVLDSSPQPTERYEFGRLFGHQVTASFEGENVTSYAGALPVIKVLDESGIIEALTLLFPDLRDPSKTKFSHEELIKQLLAADLTGNHDFTDHDWFRKDPLALMVLDRPEKPNKGEPKPIPAGKDTIRRLIADRASQCENEEDMSRFLKGLEAVMRKIFLATKPKGRIILEIDGTDVPLHGKQEDGYFIKYYNGDIYMLQIIYCKNFPLSFRLIKADHGSAHESTSMIMGVKNDLRAELGKEVEIIVRGDGAYSQEETMTKIDNCKKRGEKTGFVFRMAGNKVLYRLFNQALNKKYGVKAINDLQEQCQQEQKQIIIYADFKYRTKKSKGNRRRVSGQMVLTPNPDELFPTIEMRFVVSNLPNAKKYTAEDVIIRMYNPRGNMENWIKESKLDMDCQHASMGKRSENTIRMAFKFIAQGLIALSRQTLYKDTKLEKVTAQTFREKVITCGAHVTMSHRRFHFSLAKSYLSQEAFDTAYTRLNGLIKELAAIFSPPHENKPEAEEPSGTGLELAPNSSLPAT